MDNTSEQTSNLASSSKSEETASKPDKGETPKQKRPLKRKPGNNKGKPPAKFAKQQSKTVIFTYSILTFFSMHTEITGAPLVSGVLYDILSSRDHKMTSKFTKREFQYVVILATYYRLALAVNKSKTAVIHGLGTLKESIADLLLPDVMWHYIETLGIVSLASSIQVVPYFLDYDQMRRKSYFVDSFDYLTQDQQSDVIPAWSINDSVITKVEQGMSRALKGILELRKVKMELDGHPRFLCAYGIAGYNRLSSLCTEQIDINECKLGACYRFRGNDISEYEEASLKLPLVHEAQPIEPEGYLTKHVLSQLRAGHF